MIGAIAAVSIAMFSHAAGNAAPAGLNDAVYYSVVIDQPGAQFTPQSIRFFPDNRDAEAIMAVAITTGDQSAKSCS